MVRFLLLLASVSCFFSYSKGHATCQDCESQRILDGKIQENNFRYNTFELALNLLSARKASVIIETGTARDGLANCSGDGCSTMIFSEWIKNHGGEFYSVDIDAQNLQNAANDLDDSISGIHLVHSDSIEFLKNFNHPIDFLYLDSFDFNFIDPIPSQEHHLKEIIAAYPWLTKSSVVMIDDCDLPYGGKGKLVIEYLLNKGWGILANGYQVILVQE